MLALKTGASGLNNLSTTHPHTPMNDTYPNKTQAESVTNQAASAVWEAMAIVEDAACEWMAAGHPDKAKEMNKAHDLLCQLSNILR